MRQMDIQILRINNGYNEKDKNLFEGKKKHWNIFLTSLLDHLNGKK
jgi:hypothetical protein